MIKVLLTGSSGQLGQALISKTLNHKGINLITTSRSKLDLLKSNQCKNLVEEYKPDFLINAAAYTSVDQAESDIDNAFAINAMGPRELAKAIHSTGGKMIQISTDFVFDGNQNLPYKPNQRRNPINVYGESKAAGEEAIEDILFSTNQGIILRSSWVIGSVGRNFAITMLKLHQERERISVINDQLGSPTSTTSIANTCIKIIEFLSHDKNNINVIPKKLHWTDDGIVSWFDIAEAVGDMGYQLGLISRKANILPIPTNEYPTPAKRPKFSSLDCSQTCKVLGISQIPWKESLFNTLKKIKLQKI